MSLRIFQTAVNYISLSFNQCLKPAKDRLIERIIPDKPNSRLQKYRLTQKGRILVSSF